MYGLFVVGKRSDLSELSTYLMFLYSLFAFNPSLHTTYLPFTTLHLPRQLTISPSRSVSGPMTVKANGSDLLDRYHILMPHTRALVFFDGPDKWIHVRDGPR